MDNKVDPSKTMALVSIPYGDVLLNAEDAFALFNLLCKAEFVEFEWSSKSYKRKAQDSTTRASMKSFSHVDYAALSLNSTD